jgi:hypothetical protein
MIESTETISETIVPQTISLTLHAKTIEATGHGLTRNGTLILDVFVPIIESGRVIIIQNKFC